MLRHRIHLSHRSRYSNLLFAAPFSASAPKKKQGLCKEKKAEDIVVQTGQKIKLEYFPRVKGPSVRGINSLVAYDIGWTIRSLVEMRARTFYDLDKTEKWKVWNAMSRLSLANKRNREEKTMHHHTGSSSSPMIYTMEELKIQGEQLPIIKGFEKTYVREQQPEATEEEIIESVQSQQIERRSEGRDEEASKT
ncbi:hypothetical protein ACLB2K_007109 [Fragaria x ananassa]